MCVCVCVRVALNGQGLVEVCVAQAGCGKVGEVGELVHLRGRKIVFCERLKRKEEDSRSCEKEVVDFGGVADVAADTLSRPC